MSRFRFIAPLRKSLFWFFDSFSKITIKSNYLDVKYINENYDSIEVCSLLKNYTLELINHATSTTTFYKDYKKFVELKDFPIINKNIIRNNFEKFQSTKFFNHKKNRKIFTSGSTGTPFSIYLNENKIARNSADTIYFAKRSKFKLGGKLFYIRLWDNQHVKSKFSFWVQNIRHQNVFNMDDDVISDLLEEMARSDENSGIVAYSSVFETICKYLDRIKSPPLKINIKSIIAISEGLNEYTIRSVKKYFGTKVLSRYSASETGIIAQQTFEDSNFFINHASYIVEVLKLNSDDKAVAGELGRIVISDLFNYAVPLIRYDTGDLGVLDFSKDNKPSFKRIEGRRMDVIYSTDGELLSSHIIHSVCLFKGIIHYQLIQKGVKDYEFKLNITKDFTDVEEKKLVKLYKNYFGKDSLINIRYVDDIAILSSGKRKKVINDFNNNNKKIQ